MDPGYLEQLGCEVTSKPAPGLDPPFSSLPPLNCKQCNKIKRRYDKHEPCFRCSSCPGCPVCVGWGKAQRDSFKPVGSKRKIKAANKVTSASKLSRDASTKTKSSVTQASQVAGSSQSCKKCRKLKKIYDHHNPCFRCLPCSGCKECAGWTAGMLAAYPAAMTTTRMSKLAQTMRDAADTQSKTNRENITQASKKSVQNKEEHKERPFKVAIECIAEVLGIEPPEQHLHENSSEPQVVKLKLDSHFKEMLEELSAAPVPTMTLRSDVVPFAIHKEEFKKYLWSPTWSKDEREMLKNEQGISDGKQIFKDSHMEEMDKHMHSIDIVSCQGMQAANAAMMALHCLQDATRLKLSAEEATELLAFMQYALQVTFAGYGHISQYTLHERRLLAKQVISNFDNKLLQAPRLGTEVFAGSFSDTTFVEKSDGAKQPKNKGLSSKQTSQEHLKELKPSQTVKKAWKHGHSSSLAAQGTGEAVNQERGMQSTEGAHQKAQKISSQVTGLSFSVSYPHPVKRKLKEHDSSLASQEMPKGEQGIPWCAPVEVSPHIADTQAEGFVPSVDATEQLFEGSRQVKVAEPKKSNSVKHKVMPVKSKVITQNVKKGFMSKASGRAKRQAEGSSKRGTKESAATKAVSSDKLEMGGVDLTASKGPFQRAGSDAGAIAGASKSVPQGATSLPVEMPEYPENLSVSLVTIYDVLRQMGCVDGNTTKHESTSPDLQSHKVSDPEYEDISEETAGTSRPSKGPKPMVFYRKPAASPGTKTHKSGKPMSKSPSKVQPQLSKQSTLVQQRLPARSCKSAKGSNKTPSKIQPQPGTQSSPREQEVLVKGFSIGSVKDVYTKFATDSIKKQESPHKKCTSVKETKRK